ncbi:FxsA family protein [Puniceibacterium sp. IMCC21224]|uniref:FxsA family protein n=1 Tax=Puniceibacterium sp. IMCC21224 TaxID=1618204 RepID=UPI00064D837D|nr:FxsA family protein [Puniceibacterium sp. IMCC21224]KMK65404.1 protein affecting phage T7 exclusion by the F plasmid [Puniceibacterium sp. IMCC21224]
MWFFLAFLMVPLIEIALFIQVGSLIGLWPTLAIVVLTAILGTSLMRSQGALAMAQVRRSFSELDDPTEPLAHGAMILVAGVLLLTPGFFTDACGFALLTPPVRIAVFRYLKARINVQSFQMGAGPQRTRRTSRPGTSRNDVIDGEFEKVDDYSDPSHPKHPTHQGSGWTRH